MNNGEKAAGDGGDIYIGGVRYAKGIGCHADSEIVVALNGQYSTFISDVGIDDTRETNGNVIFRVYGDDNLLYQSGALVGGGGSAHIEVSVEGVQTLRLVVDKNSSATHDHAAWGGARLLAKAAQKTTPDPTIPAPPNPFRYCGEYYDAETSNIYLRARYYNPSIGRFISEDPIQDGTNWYVYARNNPVGFIDRTGLYAEGDEKLPDEIQIILNGVNKDGNGGLSQAWKLANERGDTAAMARIAEEADQVRQFSVSNIDRIIPVVQTAGAMGAGHTATLLLNKNDQGLLLSYWSENGTAYGPGEMRISILSSKEWNSILYNGGTANLVGSNGKTSTETYNGNLYLTIAHSDGRNALQKVASLFNDAGTYNLVTNNCDFKTAEIVRAAGKFYDKRELPNESFAYTLMYHTNYKGWLINNAIRNSRWGY